MQHLPSSQHEHTHTPQAEDRNSSEGEEDMVEVDHLRRKRKGNKNGSLRNKDYASLHQSTVESPTIYEIPVVEGSQERLIDSRIASGSYNLASPDNAEHQTRYTKMEGLDNFSTDIMSGQDKLEGSISWARRTFRRTFKWSHVDMKMVGMDGCCCTSHEQAKKFFTLSGLVLIILMMALIGVAIASVTWVVTSKRANMIQNNLDNYTTSLRDCRVGRNWMSENITRNSTPLGDLIIDDTAVLNITLDNLTLADRRNLTSLNAKQILLYVVIRTMATTSSSSNISDDVMMMSPTYINVALWTRRKSNKQTRFQHYIALYNNLPTLQIVSRNFWFPLESTDNRFYVKAELMDSDEDNSQVPLDFRVYLAGYC
jgi:hypothetical protein